MNPSLSQLWTATVQQYMQPGATFADAWNAAVKANPDLAILVSAAGKTRQQVAFVNSRLADLPAPAPADAIARLRAAAVGHSFANSQPSKAAMREQFQRDVRKEMERSGCDYTKAFNRVSQGHPLFANVDDVKTLQVAAAGKGGVPEPTPKLLSLFRLPNDTTPEEWSAAWVGNGKTASPINYGKIFSALNTMVQTGSGRPVAESIGRTKNRFPALWAAVEELAKLAF